jgi:ABC-2 type transport system ATP-binding protein
MTARAAIEATGLTKSFGSDRVLDDVDVAVPAGCILALLGPNGAGKTTMVRILATLARPDAGRARVAGYDVVSQRKEVRRRISLTGQDVALDGLQSGAENLTMIGRLGGMSGRAARSRARELLGQFDLLDAAGRRVATYSGGMRRRLDLAAGLVGRPEVIFLDEPTTGLDPYSRQTMWGVVTQLAVAGATILLTTQYLDEADQLADRVAVIAGGRIIAHGTPGELKRRTAGPRLEINLIDGPEFDAAFAHLGGRVLHVDRSKLTIDVATDGGATEVRSLLDEIDPRRTRIDGFTVRSPSLDDVFMAITGHSATELEAADV